MNARVSLLENSYANARMRDKSDATALALARPGVPADLVERLRPRIEVAITMFHPARPDRPRPSIIDFACGNGFVLAALLDSGACRAPACGVDLIELPNVHGDAIHYLTQALWEPVPGRWDFAISAHGLEYLPPHRVLEALKVIRGAAPHGFHRISTRRDPEHHKYPALTVLPPERWLSVLGDAGIYPTEYRVEPGSAVEFTY